MPIKFVQEKKKQKYLILVFAAVILITSIVLWFGFLRKEKPAPSPPALIVSQREIKIDFELLESSALKELQPFGEISSFEEEAGRSNPFLPYGRRLELESGAGSESEPEPEPET